jgi:hypothetical protein
MRRLFTALTLLIALVASPALAQVTIAFHSFDGSVLFGRYPHTFIVLTGTLDDGTPVNENYGYTAKSASPAVLAGPVEHAILIEKPKYLTTTNRHFAVPISDAQYRRIKEEVARWRDAPGKAYRLDENNCIHFVGRMAEIAGLKVDYPKTLIRKPKAWLNRVTGLNPQLGARTIR